MTSRKSKRKFDETEEPNRTSDAEKLLKALKENGPSVIHDFTLLGKYFPSKSKAQLMVLIEGYEKKGRDLCQKQNYMDSHPEMKNIFKWANVVSSEVPFPAKKDDLSRIVKDIFEEMKEKLEPSLNDDVNENADEDEKVDYLAIHAYFNAIVNCRFPVELKDPEAAIALSMIDNLCDLVGRLPTDTEKAYLASQAWRKRLIPEDNNTTTSSSQNEGETSNQSTVNTVSISVANNNNPDTTDYEDLPRIRRVKECLNPLKVPISILRANHEVLSQFFI